MHLFYKIQFRVIHVCRHLHSTDGFMATDYVFNSLSMIKAQTLLKRNIGDIYDVSNIHKIVSVRLI